jgi:fibronectin type 3 domain-containing protein
VRSRLLALVLAAAAPVAAAAPKHSIKLTWTASPDVGSTVTIRRSTNGCAGTFTVLISRVAASGPYTDTTLVAGQTYSYQLTAVINNLESAPSNCVTSPVVPISPSNVQLTFK